MPEKEMTWLTSARIPDHFELVRHVQGDEGDMPETLQ
jgi:hypothetical protein